MRRLFLPSIVIAATAMSCAGDRATADAVHEHKAAPSAYLDQPACRVRNVVEYPTTFETMARTPAENVVTITKQDSRGIYQVYVQRGGTEDFHCISCSDHSSVPPSSRNKPMVSVHPSGRWIAVGVEENNHENMWMPASWQRGLLQSGVWLNIWLTTPTGDRWFQMTDFKKSPTNPSDGFVGVSFTPDGKQAVWAEIVDGNIFANHFGRWRLYMADFLLGADGTPAFANKRDITPPGARWVEPGNFAPDNRHILLSSDIGLSDAQGQDQFVLDTKNGQLQNLTQTPEIWDEHGYYSADGRKIGFMSSYPYPENSRAISLKTEFMLMDADGSHLQQLTHFNVPGYPESQPGKTVAAVATFIGDGSQMFGTVMATDNSFTKTNWLISFSGRCGG